MNEYLTHEEWLLRIEKIKKCNNNEELIFLVNDILLRSEARLEKYKSYLGNNNENNLELRKAKDER